MGIIYKNNVRYSGSGGGGLPDGGTKGQSLVKASNADQDVEWISLPAGTDIVMTYNSDDDRLRVGEDEMSIKPKTSYRVIATGTGATWGEQAASLQDAVMGLTNAERLRSCILQDNAQFNNNYGATPIYTYVTTNSSDFNIISINFRNSSPTVSYSTRSLSKNIDNEACTPLQLIVLD